VACFLLSHMRDDEGSVGETAEAHCMLERRGARLAVPVRPQWSVQPAVVSMPVPAALDLVAALDRGFTSRGVVHA
jgi:hypothetical protein